MTTKLAPASALPISVVICARNRETVLPHCLQGVMAAAPAEVIVVDGASKDRTIEIATAAGCRVVSDRGAGLGAARQLGAELATQRYVAFVDSDVVIEAETLAKLLDEAEANGWDAIQARMLGVVERPSYWQKGEAWRRSIQERPGPAAALGCQATLIRRDLVREVTFDSAFSGAAEDGDFFFRVRNKGARIGFGRDAVAHHSDRRSLWSFARQRFWHGRGIARVLVRHRHTFSSSAASQADNAVLNTARSPRFLPFMVVSTGFLWIGLAYEMLRIALDRRLAGRLRVREEDGT